MRWIDTLHENLMFEIYFISVAQALLCDLQFFSANYLTILDKLRYLTRIFSMLIMGKTGSLSCYIVNIVQIHLCPSGASPKFPRRPSPNPTSALLGSAPPTPRCLRSLTLRYWCPIPERTWIRKALILANFIEVPFFRLMHFSLICICVSYGSADNWAD